MRIAIIALGSRGDVQPYVALGKGLAAAGHSVRLLTHEDFETLVTAQGIAFFAARGNVQAMVESPEMRELLEKGNFLAITSYTAKAAQQAAIDWANDGMIACQGVELVVVGVGGLFVGLALAEKLKIPLMQAYVFPFTPSGAFPGVLFPQSWARLGKPFNWFSHGLIRQMMWQGFRRADRLARERVLGLAPLSFWGPYGSPKLRQFPVLYGFSSYLIPLPSDWKRTLITGYWFLDTPDWTPPTGLVRFLEDGPPPIYVGFGSMGSRDPEQTAAVVLEAIERTQQRAVLLSGWGGLRSLDLPRQVFIADAVPHDWLFKRVAAVVHRGGAGTTAAGLRAGMPSVVVPFFGDQSFWGQRIARLGVGPEPIPRKQLTAEGLARALSRAVNEPEMGRQAARIGVQIRAEDGVTNAVLAIESAMKELL